MAVRVAIVALGAAGLAASVGSAVGAQEPTPCTLVATPTTRLSSDSTDQGRIAFLGGGVLLKCPSRGMTLKGDSAERYPDHDYLIGHASYDEPRFHVRSDYLNYFPAQEIVKALGSVHATLANGSTMEGPYAEYRRAVSSVRPHQQMLATSRPTFHIVQEDSVKKSADTTVVVANQVFMDGDSLIYAGGQVIITRPELVATADSSFIDEPHEIMHLIREPLLRGTKEKPFTLTGDLIDLYSRDHKLQRVLVRANAVAVSDSMTLKSDTIDLRIADDLIDHAFAWGATSRAHVISAAQTLVADSLDVAMPGQKIRLVRAIANALAEGKPDTTKFRVVPPDTVDWLRGDTIVAHFDSVPPTDSSKTPPIKRLVAEGNASSFYHMASSDSGETRPAVNYVTARRITISFDSARVATVAAIDSVHGMFVEPKPDTTDKAHKSQPPPPARAPDKPVVPVGAIMSSRPESL